MGFFWGEKNLFYSEVADITALLKEREALSSPKSAVTGNVVTPDRRVASVNSFYTFPVMLMEKIELRCVSK